MPEIKISLPFSKFQYMFVCHIRYCITSKNYMNTIGRDNIYTYWHLLSSSTRSVVFRDVDEFVHNKGFYRGRCDNGFVEQWATLLNWLKENYHKSQSTKSTTTPQPLVSYLPVVDPKLMTSSSRQTS